MLIVMMKESDGDVRYACWRMLLRAGREVTMVLHAYSDDEGI